MKNKGRSTIMLKTLENVLGQLRNRIRKRVIHGIGGKTSRNNRKCVSNGQSNFTKQTRILAPKAKKKSHKKNNNSLKGFKELTVAETQCGVQRVRTG